MAQGLHTSLSMPQHWLVTSPLRQVSLALHKEHAPGFSRPAFPRKSQSISKTTGTPLQGAPGSHFLLTFRVLLDTLVVLACGFLLHFLGEAATRNGHSMVQYSFENLLNPSCHACPLFPLIPSDAFLCLLK